MSAVSFDWFTWATRQGVFAAMLIAAAVWFATSIVTPMRDSQAKFMDAVIKSNDLNAETNRKNADVNQQNTALLTKVISNQDTIIAVQKTISDSQAKLLDERKTYIQLLEQIRDKK